MSIYSVEHWAADGLSGLESPGLDPVQSWVAPPPPGSAFMTTPQAFVWGGRGRETRLTLPRARSAADAAAGRAGQRQARHQLTVWVMWASDVSISVQDLFPVLLRTVLDFFRYAELGQTIADPTDGSTSVLQTVGEDIEWRYGPPVASGDGLYLYHAAELTVAAVEAWQS